MRENMTGFIWFQSYFSAFAMEIQLGPQKTLVIPSTLKSFLASPEILVASSISVISTESPSPITLLEPGINCRKSGFGVVFVRMKIVFLRDQVRNFNMALLYTLQKQFRQIQMYVINFDFTDYILPKKLLLINIPVLLTQLITYPLQRLQTLLISQDYITNSQFKQSQLILRQLVGVQGYPKLLHGLRYSLDFSMTQMTSKFLIFDFLMDQTANNIAEASKWLITANCLFANCMGAVISQSAFNYQTIASSLPIDKNNRDENYTKKNKVPLVGLRYTMPVALINTTIEIAAIHQATEFFRKKKYNFSYVIETLLTVIPIFLATNFFSHFAIQRQVQLCLKLKPMSISYGKGFLGTQLRQTTRGILLFCFYLGYLQYEVKKQALDNFQRTTYSSNPQAYRK